MLKTALKLALVLVGFHLIIGLACIITEVVHGVNDQDASFALVMLVYCMNLPSVWLLNWLGVPLGSVPVVLVGILQWSLIAFVIALFYTGVKRTIAEAFHRL